MTKVWEIGELLIWKAAVVDAEWSELLKVLRLAVEVQYRPRQPHIRLPTVG
jgi:hypothetical protein